MIVYQEINFHYDKQILIDYFNNPSGQNYRIYNTKNRSKVLTVHLVDNIDSRLLPLYHSFKKQPTHFSFIEKKNGFCGSLHKDIDQNGYGRKCAFNLPLKDYDSGYVIWYDNHPTDYLFEYNPSYSTLENSKPLPLTSHRNEELKMKISNELGRTILNRPLLIRTDIWHTVKDLDSRAERLLVSVQWDFDLIFDDAVKLLN